MFLLVFCRFDFNCAFSNIFFVAGRLHIRFAQAAKKMEKELRLQIERLQEDKNYNDQMYREVCILLAWWLSKYGNILYSDLATDEILLLAVHPICSGGCQTDFPQGPRNLDQGAKIHIMLGCSLGGLGRPNLNNDQLQ